jgi:hypothetical protein
MTRSGSATNGTPPKAEHATSNDGVGERQPLRAGLHERDADPGAVAEGGGVGQHRPGQVQGDGACPPASRASARTAPDPQPISRTSRPRTSAEQVRVGLAQALGAPDEVDVADVGAVLGR